MPLIALAVGAGVGLLKSEVVDRPKEKRQRKLAAKTQELSPWTGLQANPIQEADPLGSALAFGASGAQMGAGYQADQMNQKLAEKALQDSSPQLVYGAAPSSGYSLGAQYQNPWAASGGGYGSY